MSDHDPRLPSVHITRDFVEDGRQVREAVTSPVCDFCLDIGPTWEYDCADFHLDGVMADTGGKGWGSTGPWLACGPCAGYIEKLDGTGLQSRAMQCKLAAGEKPLLAALETSAVIAGFFTHKTGERRPFG